MNQSLVSVVLPTHNRADCLEKALESVRSQNYSSLEIVVVDDHSTDETPNFLKKLQLKDSRIQVVTNAENIGFVKSLNQGIRAARGKYIARIDDDDIWIDREKTKKQVDFLDANPEYVVVGGGIIRVDDSGKEISRELFPEHDREIRNKMLLSDPIVHVSVMFWKEAWERVGGYDERFVYSQDWELWARLGKIGKCYNFQEYFVRSLFSSYGHSGKHMCYHQRLNLTVRKMYRKSYPNFWKGYGIGWLSYLFSFIPIRYRISPWFLTLKRWIIW